MAGKSDEEIKKQKDLHDDGVKKHETRERKEEYDGLTLKEMRRKHSIPLSVGGEQILEAYKADESESIAKTSLGDLLKSKFTKKDSSE